MTIRSLLIAAPLIVATLGPLGPSEAAPGLIGEWKIADGTANIAIRPCGGNLCGFVSWSKDSASAVGQQVLVDMKPDGHLWFGKVINVVDGEEYTARMSLLGQRVLKVEGCATSGMFCGGQQWSRVK